MIVTYEISFVLSLLHVNILYLISNREIYVKYTNLCKVDQSDIYLK